MDDPFTHLSHLLTMAHVIFWTGRVRKRVALLQVMVTPPKNKDKGSIYSFHHYVSYVSWFLQCFANCYLSACCSPFIHFPFLGAIFQHFFIHFGTLFAGRPFSQVDRGLDARRTAGEHVAETVRLPWLSDIGGGTPMERRERLVSSK